MSKPLNRDTYIGRDAMRMRPAIAQVVHNQGMPTQAVEPIDLPPQTRAVLAKTATELKLTHKQLALSYLLVAGVPQTEAYRRVYDGDPHSSSLYSTASVLANKPKIVATVEAGRSSLNYLRAESGARTRELIARGFDEGLERTLESGDYATFGQLAKVAGTQRHVQAFAAVGADADAKALTDLTEAISSFTSELQESGINAIDVTYTVACSESQENLRTVRYIPLVDDDQLADCIPGAD